MSGILADQTRGNVISWCLAVITQGHKHVKMLRRTWRFVPSLSGCSRETQNSSRSQDITYWIVALIVPEEADHLHKLYLQPFDAASCK